MATQSKFRFVVATYYGTGEGLTVACLITNQACNTRDLLYKTELLLGEWIASCAEEVSYDHFMNNYRDYLPKKVIDDLNNNIECTYNFSQKLYTNYS